jgi:polysaccharide biosynthesis transport protein
MPSTFAIIICLILAGGATFLYLYKAVPLYSASVVLEYQPDQLRLLDVSGLMQDPNTRSSTDLRLRQIQRQLTGRELLERVAERKKLAEDVRFHGLEEMEGEMSVTSAGRRLGRMVNVVMPRNENLLIVTVEHPKPEMAAELANELVEELIRQIDEAKTQAIHRAAEQLQTSMGTLQQEWRAREKELEPHRREANELEQKLQLVTGEMGRMNDQRISASYERIEFQTAYAQAQREGTNIAALMKIPVIARSDELQKLNTALTQREVEFNNLKQRYKHKHPAYIQMQSELESLRQRRDQAVMTAVDGIVHLLEVLQARQDMVADEYAKLDREAERLRNELGLSSTDIMVRELDLQRNIHDKVMQRLKEASLTGDLMYNPLMIGQRAEVPRKPSKPAKVKISVLGVMAGLMCGVGLALALGFVDTSLKTLEDTERFLNFPVLSAVPRIADLEAGTSQIIMNDEDNFAGAEAFRSLRTSLAVLNKDKSLKTILFTSALPAEGKTFCSLNFAVSLAQQGHRTLLVECDLRRPMVAQALPEIRDAAPGVTDYLRMLPMNAPAPVQEAGRRSSGGGLSFAELRRKQEGKVAEPVVSRATVSGGGGVGGEVPARLGLEDFVQATGVENLQFLSAGTPSSDSSELLGQAGAVSTLLNEAYRRFDRVVIDSAPLLGLSDTLLLATQVHGVCLVIRAQRTPRKSIQRAVEILQRAEAPLLGVILNGLVASRSDYYSDYYHYDYRSNSTAKEG